MSQVICTINQGPRSSSMRLRLAAIGALAVAEFDRQWQAWTEWSCHCSERSLLDHLTQSGAISQQQWDAAVHLDATQQELAQFDNTESPAN